MPARKGRQKSTTTTTSGTTVTETRTTETPKANTQTGEEYLNAWVNFAKALGDTTTDFVRKFGEEQQHSYERWVAVATDSVQPRPTEEDVKEVTAKFGEWKDIAEEVGRKVQEAFTTGQNVQKDLFAAWSKAIPTGEKTESSTETTDSTELLRKFWSGLLGSAFEKYTQSLSPEIKFDDFIRGQEDSLKDFGENFRKFSYAYLTSPPFVSMFGKALDQSLELQKKMTENGGLSGLFGTIPTRQDFTDLEESMKELSEKVTRLEAKIR